MKNWLKIKPVKAMRSSTLFIIFSLSLSLVSCIKKPENPLDPSSQSYIPPSVEIISGPKEGEIVKDNTVTFVWRGNSNANEFRYILEPYMSSWSGWSKNNSATFSLLDDIPYKFTLQTRYENQNEITSVIRNFSVDAIKGPGLKFYKLNNQINLGSSVTLDVVLEDISNFESASFRVSFEPLYLNLSSVSPGDIGNNVPVVILPDFSRWSVIQEANNRGYVDITAGVLLSSPTQSIKSGSIVRLVFQSKKSGTTGLTLSNVKIVDPNGSQYSLNFSTSRANVEIK